MVYSTLVALSKEKLGDMVRCNKPGGLDLNAILTYGGKKQT